MPQLYIVQTFSGTVISRLIRRRYPQGPYCHVSLALDERLDRMYSFGRRGTYNMLDAGFIREDIERGIFRVKDVTCSIWELEVDDERFAAVEREIAGFEARKESLRFDGIGLLMRVARPQSALEREHAYYCSRFVGEVLESSGAASLPAPPRLMHPTMFSDIEGLVHVFEGRLDDYRPFLAEKRSAPPSAG